MILWVGLFFLTVTISFLLALRSMRDFSGKVSKYGLFLIKNKAVLNNELLSLLYDATYKSKPTISIEKLFRGSDSALVIFGPKDVLLQTPLNLLELEDYCAISHEKVHIWQVISKSPEILTGENLEVFKDMPPLLGEEQFWWQVVIRSETSPKVPKKDYHLAQKRLDQKNSQKIFKAQIRAVLLSNESSRIVTLSAKMQNLGFAKLSKASNTIHPGQQLRIFKQRIHSSEPSLNVTSDGVIKLLGL